MMELTKENLLPVDGEAYMTPGFFSPEECRVLTEKLRSAIAWKQEPVIIMGQPIMQPRLTAWYGDAGKSYSYTGITMQPAPWSDELKAIKDQVEAASGLRFNSALLNLYRDGNDSVGWHRDNEKSLGLNPAIASVSFGTARAFKFRHYRDKKLKRQLTLTDGSLLLMVGETQHNWFHCIPKDPLVGTYRINITFRNIID